LAPIQVSFSLRRDPGRKLWFRPPARESSSR